MHLYYYVLAQHVTDWHFLSDTDSETFGVAKNFGM